MTLKELVGDRVVVAITSSKRKRYEFTIWIEVNILTAVLNDGTVCESDDSGKPWRLVV